MSFTNITVTGKYKWPNGTLATGQVTFALTAPIQDATAKEFRTTDPIVVALDGTGAISVVLAATNDPGTSPTGVTYTVTELIAGTSGRTYNVTIPYNAAAATVDLAALAPSTAVASYTYALQTALDTETTARMTGDATAHDPSLAPIVTKVITIFAAGHGWTSTTFSSFTDDATDFALGSQAAKAVTPGGGQWCHIDKTGLAVDLTGKSLLLWLKIDDASKLDSGQGAIEIDAGDTALANYYQWNISHVGTGDPNALGEQQLYFRSGEWTPFILSFHDAITNGAPARNNIQHVRISVVDGAAGACTARFNMVGAVDEMGAPFTNGVVSLVFDDGFTSQYTQARAKMDQYGFAGTAYVIADNVINAVASTMTLAQLHALERNGWEVGGHAYYAANHNVGLPNVTAAAAEDDLIRMHNWLRTNGFRGSNVLAWPLTDSTTAVEALAARYFALARGGTRTTVGEAIRPAQPFRLKSLVIRSSGSPLDTVASLQAQIDKAYTNKSWLIITFHDLVAAGAANNQWLIADFGTIIDYLNTKGIAVRPVGDVLAQARGTSK